MAKRNKPARAVDVLRRALGDSPTRRKEIDRHKLNMAIGEQIYAARVAAGMTQAALAKRIGTTQSVISDLEDAEYQGHTMSMLRRIAEALGLEVEVRLTTKDRLVA